MIPFIGVGNSWLLCDVCSNSVVICLSLQARIKQTLELVDRGKLIELKAKDVRGSDHFYKG